MIIQRLDDHSVVPGEAVRPRFRGPSGLRQGRGGQGPFDWSVQVSAPVTNDKPLVRAVNITKSFGQHEVLKGVDMTVDTGQVVCLLGPSGSGKTTFLRLINQMETLTGGSSSGGGEGDVVGEPAGEK